MTNLEIFFLGDYRILYNKIPLEQFPTKKARGLFAYLVINRHRPHTRAQLGGIFWGDFAEDRALRNLSTTLWRIRQVIPEEYLVIKGENITFNTSKRYWLDSQSFEELWQNADGTLEQRINSLEQAVNLYKGDFLDGWYEEWALIEAERLRSVYIQALYALMDGYQTQGMQQRALNTGLKILNIDPLREDVHKSVMKLYTVLGHREAALQQFQSCKTILQQELAIDPTEEMIALYDQIRSMPVQSDDHQVFMDDLGIGVEPSRQRTPFDDTGRLPLIGRKEERAAILNRLDRVNNQEGGVILIEGEPGIGKTRIVEEISAGAEWRGMQVLWGYCGDEPYIPIIEALENALTPLRLSQICRIVDPSMISHLVQLLPGIADVISITPAPQLGLEDEKDRLLHALVTCFLALSRISPLLLIIEDWHRIDMATLEFLTRLASQINRSRLFILGTARGGDLRNRKIVWEDVLNLDRAGLIYCINLPCLTYEDTHNLVETLIGQEEVNQEISKKIFVKTKGNPLFIIEILKALYESEQLTEAQDSTWNLDIDKLPFLPKALQEVIVARLNRLSSEERTLLEMASILSDPFDYEVWNLAIGWGDDATLFHSNKLLQSQLIIEVSSGYRFGHEIIRQVTYANIDAAKRTQYHRMAGEALIECNPDRVEELARHFHHAGIPDQALTYSMQAGTRSERLHAHQSAIDYFNWAIGWAEKVGGDTGNLELARAIEKRGLAYDILGDHTRALEDFESMLVAAEKLNDISRMARARRLIGWTLADRFGERPRGLLEAKRALELATQVQDERLEAQIYRDMGASYNMLGEYSEAIDSLNTALNLFRDLGDQEGEAACLQFMAVVYHFISQYEHSLHYYQQALALWNLKGEKLASAKTLSDIGYLCLSQGEISQALDALKKSKQIFEEIGALGYLSWVFLGIGALHRYKLQCELSLQFLSQAQAYEKEYKKTDAYTSSLIALHTGMANWGLGKFENAIDNLEKSLIMARQSEIPTLIVGTLGDYGRCLRQIGDLDRAHAYQTEALTLSRDVDFQSGTVRMLSEVGLSLVASRAIEEGMYLLEQALELSKDLTKWMTAAVSINLAEANNLLGDYEQASIFSRQGVELAKAMDLWELASWGILILGEALISGDELAEAAELLKQGLDLVDENFLSITRYRILANLAGLSCETGNEQEFNFLVKQLQDMVCQLNEEVQTDALKSCLHDELKRIGNNAGIDLLFPGPGQIYALVRCAHLDQGSSLNDHKRIKILWTLDAGLSDIHILNKEGKVTLRRQRILRLLDEAKQQGADPTQEELASALNVSVRTIRNDLQAIQKGG